MTRLLRCVFAALLLAVPLTAVDDEPTSEPTESASDATVEADDEASFDETITVTATRGPRDVRDVPSSVTIVGADEIEDHSMTRTEDLVRWVPGVSVASVPTRQGSSGFVIRGVGGNRVLTQVDGVRSLEEFEFSRFYVPQLGLDLESVGSVEILKGGSSALYGSDALGGVVSFFTKRPTDYLAGDGHHLGLSASWDGRDESTTLAGAGALGGERWQGSINFAIRDGSELATNGSIDSDDSTRTAANPQSWDSFQLLGKLSRRLSESNDLMLTAERYERSVTTDVLSSVAVVDFGRIFGFPPFVTFLLDRSSVVGQDEQERSRVSIDQGVQSLGSLDRLQWRAWYQDGETVQSTVEQLTTSFGGGFFGPVVDTTIERSGVLTFEQETLGADIQVQESFQAWDGLHLLTGGLTLTRDAFDQFRDSTDVDVTTGDEVERSDELIFPTKYFPQSDVTNVGAYAQAELDLANGRLRLIPGLRWDGYELDADQNDEIYSSGNLGTEPPVDLDASAWSPKLGVVGAFDAHHTVRAQYAEGFRAPPYSHVNGGFTHLAGGLTRLPNPDLQPETSQGWELGARGQYARGFWEVAVYDTRYDDFIELIPLGFNPATGLIEFQQQNIAQAEIRGIEMGGDVRIGARWRVRAAANWTEGEDRADDEPLLSIEPPSIAAGLGYLAPAGRWGSELAVTAIAAKSEDDLPSEVDQFAAPSYQLVDLTGFVQVTSGLSLQAAVRNILDETYWSWSSVQGQPDSSIIERYSAPGISFSAGLRYSW